MPARSRTATWLTLTLVLALTSGGVLPALTANAADLATDEQALTKGSISAIVGAPFGLPPGMEAPAPGYEKGPGLTDMIVGRILATFNTLLMGSLWVYTNLVGIVLVFLGNVLDYILHVAKFADNEWVKTGWKTTRDTLNVVFILALLAIAFATIAGIESYGMKQLLPRLIVAALLVNFSLAIGGAFINFSNIAMRTLAGDTTQPGTEISIRLAQVTVIKDFFTFNPKITWGKGLLPGVPVGVKTPWEDIKAGAQTRYAIGIIIAAIMLTIVAIAIGAVALMLVIRVVALYVLLILSPVGFVFSILPQTAGYARQWWDALIKYALYGPVVVFFLTLAAKIGTPEGGKNVEFSTLSGQLGIEPKSDVAAFFLKNQLFGAMLEATFVVLFIVIALLAAQQMGVAGASIGAAVARRWIPAATGGPAASRFLWARTGAPLAAGYKEAVEERAKRRTTGRFAQLGTVLGGGLFGRRAAADVRAQMARRTEEEQVKSYKDQNLGITEAAKKASAGEIPAARYLASKKELYEELDVSQLETVLRTLANAGRQTSGEFFTLANRLREKAPATGERVISEMTGEDVAPQKFIERVIKNISKLEPGKAYAAYQSDTELKDFLKEERATLPGKKPFVQAVRIPENVVRGLRQNVSEEELRAFVQSVQHRLSAGARRAAQPPRGERGEREEEEGQT